MIPDYALISSAYGFSKKQRRLVLQRQQNWSAIVLVLETGYNRSRLHIRPAVMRTRHCTGAIMIRLAFRLSVMGFGVILGMAAAALSLLPAQGPLSPPPGEPPALLGGLDNKLKGAAET